MLLYNLSPYLEVVNPTEKLTYMETSSTDQTCVQPLPFMSVCWQQPLFFKMLIEEGIWTILTLRKGISRSMWWLIEAAIWIKNHVWANLECFCLVLLAARSTLCLPPWHLWLAGNHWPITPFYKWYSRGCSILVVTSVFTFPRNSKSLFLLYSWYRMGRLTSVFLFITD